MNKNLIYSIIYLTATTMMGRAEVEKRHGAASIKTQERICKDCYFYTGGTFCKKVKHCVNKQTPANECGYFKTKTK
jgi:hypothetical protein